MPMRLAIPCLLASVSCLHAASSDWHHVEGGSIRVVTSGAPDADGIVRGALEIRLKPGWKTYWRDPGSSGVPPTLDVSAGNEKAAVEIGFPAPSRFDDGYALWAGYDEPVALALTFRLPPGLDLPTRIEASTFLGVCESICIPVQAELTLDAAGAADDAGDAAVVAGAFAALPGAARPGFAAYASEVRDGALLVEATLPHGVDAIDLFVAGSDELTLGVPRKLDMKAGTARFSVPIVSGSEDHFGGLAYTLVTSAGAVAGELTPP